MLQTCIVPWEKYMSFWYQKQVFQRKGLFVFRGKHASIGVADGYFVYPECRSEVEDQVPKRWWPINTTTWSCRWLPFATLNTSLFGIQLAIFVFFSRFLSDSRITVNELYRLRGLLTYSFKIEQLFGPSDHWPGRKSILKKISKFGSWDRSERSYDFGAGNHSNFQSQD